MAATSRSRPCVELNIHDDHSHSHRGSALAINTTDTALGELSLNSIHKIKRKSSIESLARQLDNFHIHGDKENQSRASAEARGASTVLTTKDIVSGSDVSPAAQGKT